MSYLKEIPVDKQKCFGATRSYESNNYTSNGRKFALRGSAAPEDLTPNALVYTRQLPPPKPAPKTYVEMVPTADTIKAISTLVPYRFASSKQVTPAQLNPRCFQKDSSVFITPFAPYK
eukprot:CAMPEP_0115861842 /NCGR_PEP_ID=MMETSP0287-20121206/17866_1 /TAXON_ID=412157 /ORGANISM="Chrysochromulina rotalis, Strain UIO044" /LENGTH=117 /DNA_ID=CAMNT_0003316239 /DNA_START=71 /DNA_END=424 /DNA_ORIENTATION=-